MCRPDGAADSLALWLGYLRSYEHMGQATVTCAGACRCLPAEIDAHVPPSRDVPRVSVTAVRRIAIQLAPNATSGAASSQAAGSDPACCELRIRIGAGTSSGEHKFKLLALLLAQARQTDAWQPPGTKVAAGSTLDMMHLPNASSFDELSTHEGGGAAAARAKRRGGGGTGPRMHPERPRSKGRGGLKARRSKAAGAASLH